MWLLSLFYLSPLLLGSTVSDCDFAEVSVEDSSLARGISVETDLLNRASSFRRLSGENESPSTLDKIKNFYNKMINFYKKVVDKFKDTTFRVIVITGASIFGIIITCMACCLCKKRKKKNKKPSN